MKKICLMSKISCEIRGCVGAGRSWVISRWRVECPSSWSNILLIHWSKGLRGENHWLIWKLGVVRLLTKTCAVPIPSRDGHLRCSETIWWAKWGHSVLQGKRCVSSRVLTVVSIVRDNWIESSSVTTWDWWWNIIELRWQWLTLRSHINGQRVRINQWISHSWQLGDCWIQIPGRWSWTINISSGLLDVA